MANADYPLAAARKLRATEVDEAARVLTEHERAEAKAADDERRATEHLRLAGERLRDAPAPAGASRADELLRIDAFRDRRRAERDTARAELEAATRRHQEAQSATENARAALAQARAEAEAVERHFERWRSERALAAERRAEAEADDRASRS